MDGEEEVILKFGKFEGCDIQDVPRDYLEFLIQNNKRQTEQFEAELERRDSLEFSSQTMIEQIVTSGYRALAHRYHPDHGGSKDKMQELNGAVETIREWIRQ